MSKFTLGPWKAKHRGHLPNAHVWDIRAPNDDVNAAICNTAYWLDSDSFEESKANAHLIAAAPEMYQHMQWFCDRVDAGEIKSKVTYSHFQRILAKARGE